MSYQLTYKSFGERSILIEWPQTIDEQILQDLLNFKNSILKQNIQNLKSVTHAYASLLVVFNEDQFNFEDYVLTLKQIYNIEINEAKSSKKLWKIPVCYHEEWGIDIEYLADTKNLTVQELIERHTQNSYTVYFIGFLPGFMYLGGLDESLHTPRKKNPRLKIEKGAVAIGGKQTGVYPSESPGGWNIIGNSPVNFFNPEEKTPCFASAGDKIQFYSITPKEHINIKTLVEAGVYQLESEVLND